MSTNITEKIEKYSQILNEIEAKNAEKISKIDEIMTQEIKEKLAEIEQEFGEKIEKISQEKELLEAEIKREVLKTGSTIKGNQHYFIFNKGRVSWDAKGLDGFAVAHPEIAAFRKVGEPSVSVRRS